MSDDIKQLEREAQLAKERLEIARHTPMNDSDWAAVDASVEQRYLNCLDTAKAHAAMWNTWVGDFQRFQELLMTVKAEARYWKQRALAAESAKETK